MTRALTNGAVVNRNRSEDLSAPTVKVGIYNSSYHIRSDGDAEYLKALAEFVDRKMREIARATATVDSVKVAVLAALNIADELHRLKYQSEQADAHLATRSTQYAQLLDNLLRPFAAPELTETMSARTGEYEATGA